MTWTEETPWAADLGGIARMASSRRTQASTLTTETITPLKRAIASVDPAQWTGSAAAAFMSTAQSELPDLLLIVSGLESDASALDAYAAALESIKQDAVPIRAHRDSLKHDILVGIDKLAAPDYAGQLTPHESQLLTHSVGEKQIELRHVEAQWEELSTRRRQADAAFAAALDTATSRGKLAALTGPGAATLTDAQLLAAMRGMSAADIKILVKQHPELLDKLAKSTDPVAVNSWWSSLTPEAQAALIAAAPIVIGNLNGVAYWARDKANQNELATEKSETADRIAALEKTIASTNPRFRGSLEAQLSDEQNKLKALNSISDSLSGNGPAQRELVSFTQDDPPLAAIAIGNLDTATNVTYMVPGMDSDTTGMMGWTNAAQNLYTEQGLVGGDPSRAVVAWMGYETPKLADTLIPRDSVLTSFDAQAGAGKLDRDLAGFNSVREASGVTLNVVGHSYGTTTASLALAAHNLHVTSFVSLASAGIDTRIPDAAAIQAQNVYVGEGKDAFANGGGDYVAWTGRLLSGRTDPASPGFGATVFGVDGSGGGHPLGGVTTHDALPGEGTGYFSKTSESLRNTAFATTGGDSKLILAHDQGSTTDAINVLEKVTNTETRAATGLGELIGSSERGPN